jgi:Protein of unknown function (DUF3341)
MRPPPAPRLYGLLAEFASPQELLDAVHAARAEGYREIDAYTPFPIEEVYEALGYHGSPLPLIVLAGGALGAAGGYLLQYWVSAVDYPLNIGGRPLHSWPSFIPITFEMTILIAGLSAVLGMLALNRLPTPYHPLFSVPRFALASRDRYFLSIKAADPKFDGSLTRAFLLDLHPSGVFDVEA